MSVELSPRASEIVSQTTQLLAAGGYSGFSYADVSDRVHICKASIHHHFPSKATLVQTVVAHHRREARDTMARLDQAFPDPLDRLNAYMDLRTKCVAEGKSYMCIGVMLAAELPILPPEVSDEVRGYFEDVSTWLAALLEDGAAKGQFQLRDTAYVEAKALLSTIHGAMLTARAMNTPESFETVSRAAIQQLSIER